MEKNKKKVLIFIVCLLIIISFITVLIGYFYDNGNTTEKPSVDPSIDNNDVVSKKIEKLQDENIFFGIQKIMNDYYTTLINKESEKIINILDNEYTAEKNINKNNVFSYIKSDYAITSYVPKNIYYNPNSSVTYYFVNGYLLDVPFGDSNAAYYENINFLITVDSSNNYQIRPFESSNILNFAENYNIEYKEINNNFHFTKSDVSEETKLTIYLNEFINLLIYKTDKAYNMLDDETKEKYYGYNDFKNHIVNIYEKYSTKIFSYASKEIDGVTKYTIIDDNQNTIKITEYNTMDYKIGF